MIGRRGLGGGLAGLALTGCTPGMEALEASLAPSGAEAAAFYGVAKGIAEVAVLAEPAMAPVVAAIVAVCDPLVAALTAGGVVSSASDGALRLAAQARTLLLTAAPAVRVVASGAASPACAG